MRQIAVQWLAVVVLAARGAAACAQTPAVVAEDGAGMTGGGCHFEPWADGMKVPTSMAWVRVGEDATGRGGQEVLLVLEQTGQVRAIAREADGKARMLPVVTRVLVNFKEERGLLGIAVHPDFAKNHWVYLCYTRSEHPDRPDGRSDITRGQVVERYTLSAAMEGGAVKAVHLGEPKVVLEFPYEPRENNGPNSCGGKIVFGPDGKLYGSYGDQNRHGVEINERGGFIHAGLIFRVNDDGSVPADNPWAKRADPVLQRAYAVGIRNCFGLAFDPETGTLWDTENGPDLWDELNEVRAGFNSGWGYIMGPLTDPSNAGKSRGEVPADKLLGSTYADPVFSWYRCRGLTCAAFVHTDAYGPAMKDRLLVGEVNGSWLMRFRLNQDRDRVAVTSESLANRVVRGDSPGEIMLNQREIMFAEKAGTVTDMQIGADGLLYACSWRDGAVYVLRPGK
ncbi:MAG TPA: PQQ-dependent sugar dehydrogenase [Phycisphaerae bacterium]|nr:PQQ-dependent sugar dehydrogenase [Phycisphaerae bacterium]